MPKVQLWRQEDTEQNAVGFRFQMKYCESSMVIIFYSYWYYLLSQEKWKGCFVGGRRRLLWWDVAWRGSGMKSSFGLLPLGCFLVAVGLAFWMSHLEGDPWGSHESIFGGWLGGVIVHWSHLHLSSLWDCMGLKLLMYRAGTPRSGSVLMLHQTFGITPVVHPPQHSWVVLLCFSSKSWRKKNY